MKSETQVENEVVMKTDELLVVDLNRATMEELRAVPGIGPALAERIVTYRDTVHSFQESIEITAVPGISEKTYRAIADYLTVAPTEPPLPPEETAEEALLPLEELVLEEEMAPEIEVKSLEEVTEVMILPPTELPPEEKVALKADVAPLEEATEEAPLTVAKLLEEIASKSKVAPTEEVAEMVPIPPEELATEESASKVKVAPPEKPAAAVHRPPAERPPKEKVAPETKIVSPEVLFPAPYQVVHAPASHAPRRGGLAWLWSALLGGLLGMIFTLLVLSGINGSLDINHSPAVLKVNNQMSSLTAEMDSLRGEIGGLRQRLDTLEGLTARMEQTESAVDDLHGEVATLGQQTGALEDEVTAVSEDLAAVQLQAQQTETFFQQLQALLNELFGEAEGTPVPTPTPSQ